jgi:hypothetical protein
MRYVLPALVVAFAPVIRADDATDAKAIVEKAIKARGDKSDSKNAATAWKDAGTFHGYGMPLQYTAEWAFQAPDKYRFVFVAPFGELKFGLTVVVNGEKAWGKEGGDKTEEYTGEKREQTVNESYQLWVMSLTPLVNEKGFTLAIVKGKDVASKPTSAVKVTRDKKPAITLYFDRDSGLLVKREVMVKDEFQKWKEVLDEAYLSDYKETDGVKRFTKLKIVRDGKTMIEATLSDAKDSEKLDEKLFEKP